MIKSVSDAVATLISYAGPYLSACMLLLSLVILYRCATLGRDIAPMSEFWVFVCITLLSFACTYVINTFWAYG